MRKRILDTVYKVAKEDSRVVFIGSDLGVGTLDQFKNEMPDRFFMEGVSEGHMVGMAAGLAMSGKIVFANTIATFLTRRCFEQNIIDLGLANANVRLVANGGGLVYAPLGPTHLAFEDIAIMRTIPNMTIVVACDADEIERATLASMNHQGPIYFRLAKGGDPIVSKPEHGFTLGRPIMHRKGGEVLLIATGIMLQRALQVADQFQQQGISIAVMNVHTPKPLDEDFLEEHIASKKAVFTLEEHTKIGGLGSAVAELMAERFWDKKIFFKRVALPDTFPDQYGSQNTLLARYEIEAEMIAQGVSQVLHRI